MKQFIKILYISFSLLIVHSLPCFSEEMIPSQKLEDIFRTVAERSSDPALDEAGAQDLFKSLKSEGGLSDEQVLDFLLRNHPDDTLTLFAFGWHLYNCSLERTALNALCDRVQTDSSGSRVAAMAFDFQLSNEMQTNPTAFLDRCNNIIQAATPASRVRVCLARRADYYNRKGELKLSAMDLLHLASQYPETAQDPVIKARTLNLLCRAGFFLESASLVKGNQYPLKVGQFYNDFSADDASKPVLTREYLNLTPDLTRLITVSTDSVPVPQKLQFLARVACIINTDRATITLIPERLSGYVDELAIALKDKKLTSAEARSLFPFQDGVLQTSLDLFSIGHTNARAFRFGSGHNVEYFMNLAQTTMDLGVLASSDGAPDSDEYGWRGFDEYIFILTAIGDIDKIFLAYETTLKLLPESQQTAIRMIKFGDFLKTISRNYRKSCEIYSDVCRLFEGTPEGKTASLKLAITLYEGISFENSSMLLEEILADNSLSTEERTTARFIQILNMDAMGKKQEAGEKMQVLYQENSTGKLGPLMLSWIERPQKLGDENSPFRMDISREIEKYLDDMRARQTSNPNQK